jgi:magnesium and cobalt transporter
VLEQIVGEIEDEYDLDESDGTIVREGEGRYRVKALTEIGLFNAKFDTALSDSAFDTIGGLLTAQLGRVPKRGDVVELDDLRFEVMRADARRPHLFLVTRLPKKTVAEEFADTDEQRHPA